METSEAIKKRISVREYKAQAIDKKILEQLVDAGRRAPSARAVEPWKFVIVRKKEVLEKLGEIALNGSFIKKATAAIAVFCQDTKYYLEDGVAATENILLMAADLGLGACWIAGDKKPYVDEVSTLLEAPGNMKLISLISLGWPQEKKQQVKHNSLSDVIYWEKFL